MSQTFNRVTLVGNLGDDPVFNTHEGQSFCNFNIATSEDWNDKAGERHESTEWHKIVCIGKLAKQCSSFLRKGSLVLVVGKIQTRSDNLSGVVVHRKEIYATDVKFLAKWGDTDGNKVSEMQPMPQD